MAAPHNVGGIITTVASLHLMFGLRNAKILEHFNDFVDSEVKQVGSPYPEVVDGHFALPTGPGWGVEINEDYLKECKRGQTDEIISDPGLNMFVNADWNLRKTSDD